MRGSKSYWYHQKVYKCKAVIISKARSARTDKGKTHGRPVVVVMSVAVPADLRAQK